MQDLVAKTQKITSILTLAGEFDAIPKGLGTFWPPTCATLAPFWKVMTTISEASGVYLGSTVFCHSGTFLPSFCKALSCTSRADGVTRSAIDLRILPWGPSTL